MEKRWCLVFDEYENLSKMAINMLSGTISGYLDYVLPVKALDSVSEKTFEESNLIIVGKTKNNRLLEFCKKAGLISVPEKTEGYSIYVGESPWGQEGQIIAIAGYDDSGILYGCADFCNKYCGNILYKEGYLYDKPFFDDRFDRKLTKWQISSAPAVKTRAIWTWGHVIYDYRKFLENMVKLRLNEIVIWNDRAPLNAKDVVEYAHSLGIKVVWGFAWGWATNCAKVLENFNEETCQKIKESVLQTYEKEYATTGGDGIYFQSFTELNRDNVEGKCIATIVTELVNDVASELLEKYPALHIQFGLHATSVKTKLDIMAKVDKRVHIVWEDCGAFPYNYFTDKIEDFEETLAFTEQILSLRGRDEKFGAVLKGMLNLDWNTFEHFSESYILGERTNGYLRERQANKNKIWKIVQAGWLRNAEYARRMIALIASKGEQPIVEALVEDAMLENQIMLPVALFAEMLWNPNTDMGDMIEQVAKYPCVDFANV